MNMNIQNQMNMQRQMMMRSMSDPALNMITAPVVPNQMSLPPIPNQMSMPNLMPLPPIPVESAESNDPLPRTLPPPGPPPVMHDT
eukprot:UN09390